MVLLVLLFLDPVGVPAARWIREGDALWADGLGLSAQKAYQAALALRPMDPAVWHRVARTHAALGELEEAEAAWRRAMERGDPWALRGLAAVATQREEWEQARARWRDWALRSFSDREAFWRWAEAAMALGDEQDAQRAWETGLSYHPDDLQIRFRLGLLRGAQDPEGARALLASLPAPWKGWVDLLPAPCAPRGLCRESASDQTLRRWGFALLGARYWGEARLALTRWVERHPEDLVAMAALGYVLGRLGLDGISWLRRASESYAVPPEVHYFWGLYFLEQGQYLRAQERFAAAYQLDPTPLYALEQGRAAMLAGDLLTAERWLRRALEAEPENVEIWIMLAALYLGHQVWIGKGFEAAQEILQRAPHRVEGYEWMGWAYYLQGRWAEAERLLRQALQMAPDRPSIRYRLGMVLNAKGEREAARHMLEQTILLDPMGRFGHQALRMLIRLQGR
ncbi:MAG: tetratricopeptide repeat protein [Anaerolineae bacterium]|nr:tetratricopeptide repeat protein [Thermoflexus sp.]MDW8064633.1 tetratricopeptide repeat protein [Anaerolineae bacterium]